ncbi:hypothetical protein [Ferrovum sp.]|uniref:hypothetical protein n=1 Tax=Ferrovum sp. TaxID=2609467 RepID=UPI00261DDD1A|nr:hypothetical protein [Ferrovum sp.]
MSILTIKEELLTFYEDKRYWPKTKKSHCRVREEALWWGEKFDQRTAFEFDALQALPSDTKIKIDGGYVWDELDGDFSVPFETYFNWWRRARNCSCGD